MTRDRRDEAWSIVLRLHGTDASEDGQEYARGEFYQIVQQVQVDAAAWAQGGNRQLFTKPSYRKRMWMGAFIQYAAQSTGAQVIYGKALGAIYATGMLIRPVYIINLYQNLGVSGSMPLVLGALYVTVATMSNFLGAVLLDKVGRKPLLCKSYRSLIYTSRRS